MGIGSRAVGDVICDRKSKQWTEYFNSTARDLKDCAGFVDCIDYCPRVEERWTQREEAWYCKVIEE
jgi:hypothetical protein